jgi:hypothetical protein
VLHPGDTVAFNLRAWDPDGKPWTWQVLAPSSRSRNERIEISGDRITWHVTEDDIADPAMLVIYLCGGRSYHRRGGSDGHDDTVEFVYRVLPAPARS